MGETSNSGVKVSAVMPCYNSAEYLATSIGSVLTQTFKNWELIAVDDGSRDNTWAVLEQLAEADGRIKPKRQPNAGPGVARNRGLDEARGAYIAFLDADDTWHPSFMETMSSTLDNSEHAVLTYCGWQNLGLEGGCGLPFVPPDYETSNKTEAFLGGCRWPIHAAMTRSQFIADEGGFDPELTSCMDYDLWLRLASKYQVVRTPKVLAYYHHHDGEQITKNRARLAINHRHVQQAFLQKNPNIQKVIGRNRTRSLTLGELLHRGYQCYWDRDLEAARTIFRAVMRHGYGTPRDWIYMLPAWLPFNLHSESLQVIDKYRSHMDEQRDN